jgi:CheY-like chemotaxis protein
MPPILDRIDIESLMRDAISSIAVASFSHQIGVSAHIDNRLPSLAWGDNKALSDYLRRGLARTITARRVDRIALAFWLDDAAPASGVSNGEASILFEACCTVREGEPQLTAGLASLWALPPGSGIIQPVATRQSDGIKSVLISLPCTLDPDAPLTANKWGGAFQGRYILHLHDLMYDRERLRKSFAMAGLGTGFASSPEEALELARDRAGNGQAVDFLVLGGHQLGNAAITLAREFRADPRLAATRIALAGNQSGLELSDDDSALFDVVARISTPWRRPMSLLYDLVREPAPTPAAQSSSSRAASDIPALAGRRILIAEDVATNQMLLTAVLAPTGADVEVVADGAEVLKRHSEAPADMILMDLQMPGMGGIAAMRELRAMGGELATVPVLALTAYARSADRQLALDAGMDAYMAKPIIVAEFYDLLQRLLSVDGAEDGAGDGDG